MAPDADEDVVTVVHIDKGTGFLDKIDMIIFGEYVDVGLLFWCVWLLVMAGLLVAAYIKIFYGPPMSPFDLVDPPGPFG
jgi:hypothetical protein